MVQKYFFKNTIDWQIGRRTEQTSVYGSILILLLYCKWIVQLRRWQQYSIIHVKNLIFTPMQMCVSTVVPH